MHPLRISYAFLYFFLYFFWGNQRVRIKQTDIQGNAAHMCNTHIQRHIDRDRDRDRERETARYIYGKETKGKETEES